VLSHTRKPTTIIIIHPSILVNSQPLNGVILPIQYGNPSYTMGALRDRLIHATAVAWQRTSRPVELTFRSRSGLKRRSSSSGNDRESGVGHTAQLTRCPAEKSNRRPAPPYLPNTKALRECSKGPLACEFLRRQASHLHSRKERDGTIFVAARAGGALVNQP
jgi:hypothetical protein